MANRLTVADLRNAVESVNRELFESGSNYFLKEGGRNGYQAVDLYAVEENGEISCERNLVCGTSRECIAEINLAEYQLTGKLPHYMKPTRAMAKAVLAREIDFTSCSDILPGRHVDALLVWAKLTKYKRPRNANGSTGRYFFYNLAKRVKI